ncbi:MAG: hypothetical protein L3K18_09190 [Thermoplasmata archaeon]|nr:hypothetical protein [Thermoplasmata archaeon]MCI4357290.1 hypothetical protein [Thermoplasmata archaeon]
MSALQRLPFWAALIVLAGGTAAGVYVGVRTGDVLWILVTLAIVVAFAILYLREYSQLPGPPETDPYRATSPTSASTPSSSEGFASAEPAPVARTDPDSGGPVEQDAFDPDYDPVADADKIESTAPPPVQPDDEPRPAP